jgi:bifunctional UDP-N-acetylglucosamine pyrophosphorylase/glucosamine-1-phosphate N-acetyltransferase
MTASNTAAIVLAAGLGTRMNSDVPKALHPIAGRAMIGHVLDRLEALGCARMVTVISPAMSALAPIAEGAFAPAVTAIQHEPLGTGHAALAAKDALEGFSGDVLILCADTPLITEATLTALLAVRRAKDAPAVAVLGFRPAEAAEYGRMVCAKDGALEAIVEFRDADAGQRAIPLCNAGAMAVDGEILFGLLESLGDDNAKGEIYLTDMVAAARAAGHDCAVIEAEDPLEVLGINSRADLARAEAVMQDRLRATAMNGGATLTDPSTVWFSFDTRLGRDVTVGPNVVFGPGVSVADNVEIRGFCHIEGADVGAGALIGPFARLRPGADIGEEVHVGNFVEIKESRLESGVKVNHLSYVGDSSVGEGANIGAGTITCNYDGFFKERTVIGAGAFIGSNAALVAPVKIGAGAVIGAGSVITRDVAGDAMAVTRADQIEVKGGAVRYRSAKQAKKDAGTGSDRGSGKKKTG